MRVAVDDIRATLPALNNPILEFKMAAVPVEEQKRERKLTWCFLTAEVNSNETVAIADLVGGALIHLGMDVVRQLWQRNVAVLLA
jgi:hypothetical protein